MWFNREKKTLTGGSQIEYLKMIEKKNVVKCVVKF